MALKDKKEERLETRLSAEAKLQIEQAAALQGRSLSDFVVQAALDQAYRVLEQQRILRLNLEESQMVAKMMMEEPKINRKAVAAIKRYKKAMGN